MSKNFNYSISKCEDGIVIPFSGIPLSINDTYVVNFTHQGSTPSGTVLLNPSGYSYTPSSSLSNIYTTAQISGIIERASSHLVKLSISLNGTNVYTDFASIECGLLCVTQTPTMTQTMTPTATNTPTSTVTSTSTVTPTTTPTQTNTPSNTTTQTPTTTETPTNTPTSTATPTNSSTPTNTPTNTSSPTTTPTNTPTRTTTPTNTITPSATAQTPTPTPSQSQTPLPKPVDFTLSFDSNILDLNCCESPKLLTVQISGQPNVAYNYSFSPLINNDYIVFDNPSGTIFLSQPISNLYTNVQILSGDTDNLIKCRLSDQYNTIETMAAIRCNNERL